MGGYLGVEGRVGSSVFVVGRVRFRVKGRGRVTVRVTVSGGGRGRVKVRVTYRLLRNGGL